MKSGLIGVSQSGPNSGKWELGYSHNTRLRLAAAKIRKVDQIFAKKVEKEESQDFWGKSGHCTKIRKLGKR